MLDIRDPGTFQGPDAPADDDLATCVHCGLCLNACPTYRITGLETESPRGRIYLMTHWKRGDLPFTEELARHIDLCLGCRTCEAVCPSGVPYGRIIEGARAEVERLRRPTARGFLVRQALRQLLAHPGRLRAAGILARGAQALGLTAIVPQGRGLPRLAPAYRPPRGGVAPALGVRRHRVAFLTGCVMPILYPSAHEAAVRLLQLAGCEVWFPPEQRCCGALFAHNGDLEGARRLRDHNQRVFGMEQFDVLVVDSAGCGSHLKDFYPNLGRRVQDLTEFLDEVGLPQPQRELRLRVTYQDACHLVHAQRIRHQPRRLLRSIPGVELAEMAHPDICCGSAGLYATLQPRMSRQILDEKLDDLLATEAQVVVTANPGCQMQLEAGLRARGRSDLRVAHVAELLLEAYRPPAS
ncbi:MAG TPA: (Fe-S)-binding protein [Candidatus Dormibacteraeota bacterium]|nr:(Fe-S)-binding protein [Candidatus Dormibacteraeota bacterium]